MQRYIKFFAVAYNKQNIYNSTASSLIAISNIGPIDKNVYYNIKNVYEAKSFPSDN